ESCDDVFDQAQPRREVAGAFGHDRFLDGIDVQLESVGGQEINGGLAWSNVRPAPRLAQTMPSGLCSRITVNEGAVAGSSSATPTDPEAMGTPVAAAALASAVLIGNAVSVPPVMPLM